MEYEIDTGSEDEHDRSRNDRDGSSAEDSDVEVKFSLAMKRPRHFLIFDMTSLATMFAKKLE